MSKIGYKPIEIPEGVNVTVEKVDGYNRVKVKKDQNELKFDLPVKLDVELFDKKLLVKRLSEVKQVKSVHGLFRSLINNAIVGVVNPWVKKLEIVGTGFNVKLQGEDLVFKLGFSHPVVFKKVEGIKYGVEGNNKITISGADKQLVGQVTYQIKIIKKPDPYKGKGIRYLGEQLKLKPGKKAKTEAA